MSIKIQILSHRGYWYQPEEKNSFIAFHRSFALGLGTELDVRDYCGKIVISHHIPDSTCLGFETFLDIYCKYKKNLYIAINIKADGLQGLLHDLLDKYQVKKYFVFDMSVPDALSYLNLKIKSFTRESEFETVPSFYEQADGVWMDEFRGPWITPQRINHHLENGKRVCIVSPELHQMAYLARWKEYKVVFRKLDNGELLFCTDFPEEAGRYFHD